MKRLVLPVVLCIAVAPARANPKKQEADAAYKLGQSQYMREDYMSAAQSFKIAYEADPDPVYLFNVAQAYRLAKQCVQAGEYYRRFLREAKKAPNEAAVKAYIDEVDACAKQAGQTPIEEPPPEQVVEPPRPEEQPIDTTPIPTEPRDSGGSNKRLISYVLGGAGVVGVGVGVYFVKRIADKGDRARELCMAMNGVCTVFDPEVERIESDARTDEKVMVTSFIAGGALIAAGVTLFVLGGDAKKESPVTIAPTKHGATATLSIDF